MIDEIKGLMGKGVSPDDLIYYGLEYKYVTLYCTGQLSYDDMVSQLEIAIHQFAKRQMTLAQGHGEAWHKNQLDWRERADGADDCQSFRDIRGRQKLTQPL